MAVDFSKLLQTQADEIKRPSPLPDGTYYGFIDKREFGTSREKQTPYCRFTIQLREVGPDVDEAAWKAAEIDLTKKSLTVDYYLTPDALYRLADALKSLGIPTAGRTLEECIEDSLKMDVAVKVRQEMDRQDPTIIRVRADGFTGRGE